MAYFARTGPHTYTPTEHVSGAWTVDEQHIAPALGLLVHRVVQDRDARRDDRLLVSRLSYDILGAVPMEPVDVTVQVLRPGRTIELVEAVLACAGRNGVILRAWLVQRGDTTAFQGTGLTRIPPPQQMDPFDATTVWPGGFIESIEVRRTQIEPGRAAFWARTPVPLVDDEPVSPVARFVGLLDVANGMTVRQDPRRVAFPNIDLTAHLAAEPVGEWVGFDTTVTFGADGAGVTASVLHDETGPIGHQAQSLVIRP